MINIYYSLNKSYTVTSQSRLLPGDIVYTENLKKNLKKLKKYRSLSFSMRLSILAGGKLILNVRIRCRIDFEHSRTY